MMVTGIFERECKGIFQANDKMLKKVTKTCDLVEKEKYLKISEHQFLVVRAAGSFGTDLVALRYDISFPIEVKSSASKTVHFSSSSGRAMKQAIEYQEACKRSGLLPIYAFRLKNQRGDPWRIFVLETSGIEGIAKIIYDRIPNIQKSSHGQYVMKWKDGMKLSDFIDYLCMD